MLVQILGMLKNHLWTSMDARRDLRVEAQAKIDTGFRNITSWMGDS